MADRGLVLVTGATGFVGKWTVIQTLKAGYPVRGTIRSMAKAGAVRDAVMKHAGAASVEHLELVPADLLDDRGWADAMRGVKAVLHTATVVLGDEPRDSSIVIRPAVEGTERVLRFAEAAGVKRVVITSSIATVGYGHGQTTGRRVYDETHFTNIEGMRWTWAYCIGKTRAEQAAWKFAQEKGMELTTIHPGAILGPAADTDTSVSLGMVTQLMDGTLPAMPSNGFCVIDVRDVADLHVAALEKRESIGERYLATGPYLPFPQVAEILREAYPKAKVTLRVVPDWVIRAMAFFGGPTRQIINDIGNEKHFDGSKGEALLGRKFISPKDATLATAASLIALGVIKTG